MSAYDTDDILQSPAFREELAVQRTYMARVYGWMTIGLLTTALTSLVFASNTALMKAILTGGTYWIFLIAWIGVALIFNFALRVIPTPVAAGLFVLYSILTGAACSVILLIYTLSSVAGTFFITAGMFGGMSAFGYITKRNLDGVGSFCIMGLWGLIIASIVNMFIASSGMQWIISFVGVIVFTGLTAYDTQKIKQSYAMAAPGTAAYQKSALFGAFALYLDFVNLFLYLIQFLGKRKD